MILFFNNNGICLKEKIGKKLDAKYRNKQKDSKPIEYFLYFCNS